MTPRPDSESEWGRVSVYFQIRNPEMAMIFTPSSVYIPVANRQVYIPPELSKSGLFQRHQAGMAEAAKEIEISLNEFTFYAIKDQFGLRVIKAELARMYREKCKQWSEQKWEI